LKVGASEAAAAAAQAHTGSLVGDDRVFDALCERMAMTRVNSLEELIVTADIFARVGPVAGEGPAMVALSGGLCEIAIDQAEAEGVPLAPLADKTKAELRAKLPAMIRPGNPLDVTGAAMREPALIATALSELSKDPSVGLVTFNFDIPPREDKRGFTRGFVSAVGAGFAQSDKPCLMFSHTASSVSGDARALAAAAGVPYSGGGLTFGLRAIGRLFRWSAARGRASAPAASRPETSVRPRSEHEVLDHLKAYGVGVVPALIARSADEAAAHARAHGREVALKIASPDIAHKTEVGGVALGLRGEEAVRAAYERVTRSVADARPDAAIDGVIVAPMRQGGVELFVGVMRDPQWGPSIAVGLGGILVEALRDTSLRLLPITSADALAMLSELRGEALLDGFRGAPAVDRAAAAETIVAVGEAALALGPDLISLEVNPLLAAGTRIEALDGLALWSKPA
ncbi:MAG: acetate--CoA ligase family protein, partial [Caulobacterales bacterium]|nr:acetate--CoA ligase family protein [Caulobacterales bacterium]